VAASAILVFGSAVRGIVAVIFVVVVLAVIGVVRFFRTR
jgi:hypothetical protein